MELWAKLNWVGAETNNRSWRIWQRSTPSPNPHFPPDTGIL